MNSSASTPHTRTLQRASDTLGSSERLAILLDVPHAALVRWISGLEPAPHEVFVKALDIVAKGHSAAQDIADRAQTRADSEQARADRSQSRADQDQASANRSQEYAREKQDEADASNRKTEQSRQVGPKGNQPAANAPDIDPDKSTG